jgi:hypothetical protein
VTVRKVLISMSDDLLQEIDRESSARGMTRSRFLEGAARRELDERADRIRAALERGQAALADAGSFDAAQLVRAGRDTLDARDQRRR